MRELDISPENQTWPSSIFSLVVAAFLLPFGRLCDIYSGRIIFILGLLWLFIWSLVAGFSQNSMMMIISRALQGLGPAAFLPSGVMLLGSIYRPGPRKNMVFCLYGACAPLGFFIGIFFSGITGQYIKWSWYFWLASIILICMVALAYLSVPSSEQLAKTHQPPMDWWGTVTLVPSLILLVFAITDSSHAPKGWANPYINVPFILGVLGLGAFVYVECRVAESPLLPLSLFAPKSMIAVSLCLLCFWGTFGIYLMYASL
jgi:MFS family permease